MFTYTACNDSTQMRIYPWTSTYFRLNKELTSCWSYQIRWIRRAGGWKVRAITWQLISNVRPLPLPCDVHIETIAMACHAGTPGERTAPLMDAALSTSSTGTVAMKSKPAQPSVQARHLQEGRKPLESGMKQFCTKHKAVHQTTRIALMYDIRMGQRQMRQIGPQSFVGSGRLNTHKTRSSSNELPRV